MSEARGQCVGVHGNGGGNSGPPGSGGWEEDLARLGTTLWDVQP